MNKRALAIIGSLLALLAIIFIVNYGKIGSIKGSLLSDQEIAFTLKARADANNDSILTAKEIRRTLVSIIRGVILGSAGNDINGDGSVNRDDITVTVRAFRALLLSVCGNSTIDAGEQCDDGDTDSGDGCSNVCGIESGYTCTGTPSVCTQNLPSSVALEITVLPLPASADVHSGSQNLTLLKFRATAGSNSEVLKTAMFGATMGNIASLTNLSLWRDTTGDGIADTKVLDRHATNSTATVLVFFDAAATANRTIAAHQSAIFEVRGDIAASAPVPSDIQLGFKADLVNFIGRNQTDTPNPEIDHLVGISVNGLCLWICEIDVTTMPSTLFRIVAP